MLLQRKDTRLQNANERGLRTTPKSKRKGHGQWFGEKGFSPLPNPRVTLRVYEKVIDFTVDTGTQNSVPIKANGPMTNKRTGVQRIKGAEPYSHPKNNGFRSRSDNQLISSNPRMSVSLIGHDLLANMKAYKPFSDEGAKLNNKD